MTNLIEKIRGFEYVILAVIAAVVLSVLMTHIPAKANDSVPSQAIEKQVAVQPTVQQPQQDVLTANDEKQIKCLAENAYFEAGNQSTKGKIAVSNVVMNRVEDKRFPKTPCGVIHQKSKGVCQFSWVCEGKKRIRDWIMYAEAERTARLVYLDKVGDVTHGAKFYHANYVNPRWGYDRVATIGAHIFYQG